MYTVLFNNRKRSFPTIEPALRFIKAFDNRCTLVFPDGMSGLFNGPLASAILAALS